MKTKINFPKWFAWLTLFNLIVHKTGVQLSVWEAIAIGAALGFISSELIK